MPTHDSLQQNNGMFGLDEDPIGKAVIKVIGVGGGGNNAVLHMVRENVTDVEFICANTDAQVIRNIEGALPLQLGANVTSGLGAGASAEKGRAAAQEDKDRILEVLEGVHMVFITAGMGGGTGTGAAPVVAELARERGILTVGVVTKPFSFEGKKRMRVAEAGIEALRERVDSLIVIENDKLLTSLGDDATLLESFAAANDVLRNAVQGISDLITHPGLVNVDFADVETVMRGMGMSMMGIGVATGEDRAQRAAEQALRSPLLQAVNLSEARGLLVNITAGTNLTMREVQTIGSLVNEVASEDGDVIVGTAINPDFKDEIRVTLVATGIEAAPASASPKVVVDNPGRGRPVMRQAAHGHAQRSPTGRPMQQPAPRTSARTEAPVTPSGQRPLRTASGQVLPEDLLDIPTFLRRQAD